MAKKASAVPVYMLRVRELLADAKLPLKPEYLATATELPFSTAWSILAGRRPTMRRTTAYVLAYRFSTILKREITADWILGIEDDARRAR